MNLHSASSTWSLYRQLLEVVNASVFGRAEDLYQDLEATLRRHKPDLLTLAEKPKKNSADRDEVKRAATVGVSLSSGASPTKLPPSVITETIELSDFLNLNEKTALELLLVAEQQLPRFPQFSRQQVAILLFQDGRQSVYTALRALVQARDGNMWTLSLSPQVTDLIMRFTDELYESGLIEKVLQHMSELQPLEETSRLKGSPVGDGRLIQQVADMVLEQRNILADCLFFWSCQQPFCCTQTLALLQHLKKLGPGGSAMLDHVGAAMVNSLFQCFTVGDLLLWQQRNDDEPDERYPVTLQQHFIKDCHKAVLKPSSDWAWPELGAAVKLAWGILLRECSKLTLFGGTTELEDDERVVVTGIKEGAFQFLRDALVRSKSFHQEELYVRRLHHILASLIVHMHLKVKEMCYQVSDQGTGRSFIHRSSSAGGRQATNLQDFLYLLGDLYGNESGGLGLSLEYWCVPEADERSAVSKHHATHRQLTLLRFLHTCCDVLQSGRVSPSLFLAFLHLLQGLANSPAAAHCCYAFLSPTGSRGFITSEGQKPGGVVSWDHFFQSMKQYYLGLRQDIVGRPTSTGSGISPEELAGLQAVLQLTRTVVEKDEAARTSLFENQSLSPVPILFGLVSSSVPRQLKAEAFLTLASFARSPEIAASLWVGLEQAQVVRTLPTTSTPKPRTTPFGQQQGFTHQQLGAIGSIELELEEIESQDGDYCETRAFLTFMDAILDVPIPPQLGHAHRTTPGFAPYLCFLVDSVFMKFDARTYTDPAEKWLVAASVLEVLHKLLVGYQVRGEDFVVSPSSSFSPPPSNHPGFTLLLHLMRDSKLLRKLLFVLGSCADILDEQVSLLDTPDENMERTALLSLKILEVALEKQDAVLEAVRGAEGGVRMESVEPLDRLLVCLDGTPNYLIKVMRYIPMLQCSPELALSAVNVLCWVVRCQRAVRELVYALDTDKDQCLRILHGFVERLECVTEGGRQHVEAAEDIDGESPQSVAMVQESIKTNIMRLILYSVDRPAPNLAHVLLGYNINKQLSQTELQNPGIMGAPYTVLHSVIAMVAPQGETLSFASLGPTPSSECSPQLKELAYCLLYNLCCHSDLAGPTLRYLRHNFNFFCVHLKSMPFQHPYSAAARRDMEETMSAHGESLDQNESAVIRQEAWFLRTLAIELRITAQKRYFSQTHQILSLLLAESSSANQSAAEGLEQGDSDGALYGPLGGSALGSDQKCISTLLSKVNFSELNFSSQLQLQHFEMALIQQVAQGLVEADPITGASQVNIKALHRLLVDEVNQVPGLAASGKRPAVMREVHDVLVHFVKHNRVLQNVQARKNYFEGWRQVVELMFAIDGGDRLKGTSRLALVLELLQDMLLKLNVHQVAPELASSAHGLVVALMSHLRHAISPRDVAMGGTLQQVLRPTSLQALLKGLVDNLMQNRSSAPQLRTFIYGSLLYYLQLSVDYSKEEAAPLRVDLGQGPWMEYSGRASLSNMNMTMLNNYGENLMEMVCKDASSGHDVTKMLSLALLGALMSLDRQGRWLRFMTQKGYLRGLATSVHWDDEALQKTLLHVPEPLKSLYVYESKMAFLARVATHVLGTRELLASNVLVHLSECKFIGMRPTRDEVAMEASSRGPSVSARAAGQPSVMEYGGFVPSVMERYHQLLFPVLRLMAAILTNSGPAYREAAAQVMKFVESHVDAFVAVLNQGGTLPTLAALQELALVTMVISRAGVGYDMIAQDPSYVNPVSLVRVQTAMNGLVNTFWSVSNWKDIVIEILENEGDPSTKRRMEQEVYTLVEEISANLAVYCRANMTIDGEELTSHSCRIIFSPDLLLRATPLDKIRGPLSLGLAISHLNECVDNYPILSEELQKLERKLESEAELEDSEMLPEDQQTGRLSIQEKVLAGRRELVKHMKSIRKQLMLHSYIMENILYLVWRHLQFYLVLCKPSDFAEELIFKGLRGGGMRRLGAGQQESILQSPRSGRSFGGVTHDISRLPDRVTRQQLEKLREDLSQALPEPLLKKLIDIEVACIQKEQEVRVNFVQAVVRRIRRLLQQHCPSAPGL